MKGRAAVGFPWLDHLTIKEVDELLHARETLGYHAAIRRHGQKAESFFKRNPPDTAEKRRAYVLAYKAERRIEREAKRRRLFELFEKYPSRP